MAVQGTPSQQRDRSAIVRALHLVLRLLAVAVFTQAVFAGLFLDGNGYWLGWHEANASLIQLLALVQALLAVAVWRTGRGPAWLALAGVVLLLAVVVQAGAGYNHQLALHVPLGVAILGLTGTLLGRTRTLLR
jgi:hypothetical protein